VIGHLNISGMRIWTEREDPIFYTEGSASLRQLENNLFDAACSVGVIGLEEVQNAHDIPCREAESVRFFLNHGHKWFQSCDRKTSKRLYLPASRACNQQYQEKFPTDKRQKVILLKGFFI
jgi:hypothetical protein